VNSSRGMNWILSLKAPTIPHVVRQHADQELLGACFTRSSASVMLPLVSSITMTVIGSGELSKDVISCRWPLS
jgi:hypothetical protein